MWFVTVKEIIIGSAGGGGSFVTKVHNNAIVNEMTQPKRLSAVEFTTAAGRLPAGGRGGRGGCRPKLICLT